MPLQNQIPCYPLPLHVVPAFMFCLKLIIDESSLPVRYQLDVFICPDREGVASLAMASVGIPGDTSLPSSEEHTCPIPSRRPKPQALTPLLNEPSPACMSGNKCLLE